MSQYFVRHTDVASRSNCSMFSIGRTHIGPDWVIDDSNAIAAAGGSGINQNPITADGDLIIYCTWGSGVQIYRINDNGSLTFLSGNLGGGTNGTQTMSVNNYAVDKVRKRIYVSQYGTDIYIWDYTDPANPVGVGLLTGVTYQRMGYPYHNGLAAAGDYLYFSGPYNTSSPGTTIQRYHMGTAAVENLPIVNNLNVSRRYGWAHYDEANDRVFMGGYNGERLTVVINASQAGAEVYYVNTAASGGGGTSIHWPGVVVDNTNVNHIWVATSWYLLKMDISGCITPGGSNTPVFLHNSGYLAYTDQGFDVIQYFRFGAPSAHGSDLLCFFADRGYGETGMWYDQENNNWVGMRYGWWGNASTGNPLYADYASPPTRVQSANGTWYIVSGWYGGDSAIHVWPTTLDWELKTSYSMTFGPFTDGSAIRAFVFNANYVEPSGTSMTWEYSTNNSTWYTFTPNEIKEVADVGTSIWIRMTGSGTATKGAYVHMPGLPSLTTLSTTRVKPQKRTRFRLMSGG